MLPLVRRALPPPPSRTRATVWNGLGFPVVPPAPAPPGAALEAPRARLVAGRPDWFERLQAWAEWEQRGVFGVAGRLLLWCAAILLGLYLFARYW